MILAHDCFLNYEQYCCAILSQLTPAKNIATSLIHKELLSNLFHNILAFNFLLNKVISHTILENIHFRKCFAVDVKLIAGGVDIDLDTSNYAIIVCVSV